MSSEKNRAIIEKDLEAIYIGNLNTVEENLVLPEKGEYGSLFVWETEEERFIQNDGTVHRPLHGMGNRNVVLKVTAFYEGCSDTKEFTATVLQEAKETLITHIEEVVIEVAKGEKVQLPSVVIARCSDGRQMTVPVEWEKKEVIRAAEEMNVKGRIDGSDLQANAQIRWCSGLKEEKAPRRKSEFFPLNQVRLLEGTLYYKYQQCMTEYLLGQDDDQMLYNFRVAAGLNTRGADPMTGWDAADCKLKGHTTGHYLSGIALAFAATGNVRFKEKIDYMVKSLKECQDAFEQSGDYHKGFLSAYSEEQFDLLEEFTRYPEIWAPYYTLDKIMSGLYDCWQFAENECAMDILKRMGDWVYERLSRLSKETLDKMWSMYIAGEFGGMLGIMVKLYQASGDEKYLKTARLFENEKLFYPMKLNYDTLEDMHANQHIPQIIGAMDMFQATGDKKYWEIGKHFWDIVTEGHTYCIGGVGETEMFHRAGTTCSYLTEKAAESCASYNMLRLTAQLFAYTMDGRMMDYYDNTLRNHILTSNSHTPDGGTTYFMPLGPGQQKEYSTTENTCCHGTGMESRFRYMENIYSYDTENVYINFFADSVLSGDTALTLQSSREGGKIRISCQKDMDKILNIHIPDWAERGFAVTVNGKELKEAGAVNGYLRIPQLCKENDVVEVNFPEKLQVTADKFAPDFVNLKYGPYILAAVSDKKEFMSVPDLEKMKPLEDKLHYEADNVRYIPLAEVDLEPYHTYFKR